MKTTNFYIQDILSQPQALRTVLKYTDLRSLSALADQLRRGEITRLVLAGMGASYYAAYPAWLSLTQNRLPAIWMDAAELLHYVRELLDEHTLLWAFSQSGRSVEIATLLQHHPGPLLATTNDAHSPLAEAANVTLLIHAEPEQTVSTRTFLNSLAVGQLAAFMLAGAEVSDPLQELNRTSDVLEQYLTNWEKHLEVIGERLGLPETLAVLGRGPSLAAAMCGALIQMEAAKFPALGMHTAEFRHGPIEIAQPGVHVIVLAGQSQTQPANHQIYVDLKAYGAQPHWLDCWPGAPVLPNDLPAPTATGAVGLPLAEMLPLQLLSVHLAQASGIEPGKFRFIGKVTLRE